jgi:tetratricopeptide (TPR) repeat protein
MRSVRPRIRLHGATTNGGRSYFFETIVSDLARAIDSFRVAIKLDPNYPQAYAMLADACGVRSALELNGQWLQPEETAAAIAMRLAPMLPEAQVAHAENVSRHGHPRTSIDAYVAAYELDPRSARTAAKIGYMYDFIGRPDLGHPMV